MYSNSHCFHLPFQLHLNHHPRTQYPGGRYASNSIVAARGNLKEAEKLDRRCLAIKTAAHGPDHPSRAVTMNNLAQACRARGALDEAEQLYRQAAEIWDGVYGDGHPLVATVLNNLGLIVHQRGDRDQATLLLRRALAIDEAVFGPSHPSVARDQNVSEGLAI